MYTLSKESIETHLNEKNIDALKQLLREVEEMEILAIITELEPDEQVIVYRLLSKETALFVFEQLDTSSQQILLNSFTEGKAIEMMNDLSPDVRVQLLEELPATVARRLVAKLSPEERAITNILMGYEAETAGRVMTTEYIALKGKMTVAQSLQKIKEIASEMETIYTLYVTNQARKLEGVLSLKDLILAESDDLLEDLMQKVVIQVTTDTDQEDVARTLQRFDLLAVPVVDKENRLVGIITVDDAMDIMEEEVTEDVLDTAGIADVRTRETNRSETLVFGSLFQIWKLRLPFLIFTLIGGMLSATVIGGFEETLESIAIVAIFIPIIMDMGGNVGTQSAAVFTRGMILGHIKVNSIGKNILKEILVGLTLGSMVGIVAGTIAGVIGHMWHGVPQLGLAVGFSLIFATTLASLLGFLIPMILVRMNIDQVTGAGPIITSIKDISGLLVYFTLVNVFLGFMIG